MIRSILSRRELLRGAAAGMAAAATHSLRGSSLNDISGKNPKGTTARIVTTCQNGEGHATVEGNRDYMLALFDRAKVEGCPIRIDYVRLPEQRRGRGRIKSPRSESVS